MCLSFNQLLNKTPDKNIDAYVAYCKINALTTINTCRTDSYHFTLHI